jgi:hypothetical protein
MNCKFTAAAFASPLAVQSCMVSLPAGGDVPRVINPHRGDLTGVNRSMKTGAQPLDVFVRGLSLLTCIWLNEAGPRPTIRRRRSGRLVPRRQAMAIRRMARCSRTGRGRGDDERQLALGLGVAGDAGWVTSRRCTRAGTSSKTPSV